MGSRLDRGERVMPLPAVVTVVRATVAVGKQMDLRLSPPRGGDNTRLTIDPRQCRRRC